MTQRWVGFEGLASGTTWNVANSGGAAGDAISVQTGGGTATVSSAQYMHGSRSLLINTAANQARSEWTGLSIASGAIRLYLRLNSGTNTLVAAQDVTAFASGPKLQLSATRQLRVVNQPGSTVHTFAALALDTWYRLELYVVRGTTTTDGTIQAAYYLGDSSTPVETAYLSTTANTGTVNYAAMYWGKLTGGTVALSAHFDDILFDDAATGLLGPMTSAERTDAWTWQVLAEATPATAAWSWAVRAQGVTSSSWSWAVRQRQTTMSTPWSWAVRAQGVKTQAWSWAVRAQATKTSAWSWAVRRQLTTPATWSWAVRQQQLKPSSWSWAVRAQGAPATASWTWAVRRQLVTTSSAWTWAVRQRLVTPATWSWAVRQQLAKTAAWSWAVRQQGTPATASWSWKVLQQQTVTYPWSWDTLGQPTAVFTWSWGVRQQLAKTSAWSWAVRQQATKTAAWSWGVRRQLVTTSSAWSWGVRQQAVKTQAWSWAVASTSTKTAAWSWAVRQQLSKTSAWSWGVRQQQAKTSAWSWAVRQQLAKTSAWSWAVRARATKTAAWSWGVRQRLSKTAAWSWNVTAASGGSRVIIYEVGGEVAGGADDSRVVIYEVGGYAGGGTPLVVTIDGPTMVEPFADVTLSVVVTGGTAQSYLWQVLAGPTVEATRADNVLEYWAPGAQERIAMTWQVTVDGAYTAQHTVTTYQGVDAVLTDGGWEFYGVRELVE